jgi:hypothetical protein
LFAETHCAPEQYVPDDQAKLMGSAGEVAEATHEEDRRIPAVLAEGRYR